MKYVKHTALPVPPPSPRRQAAVMRTIQLLFYRVQPVDHWINRLVALLDPPFVHVEVCFEDGMASSIFAGERVFFRHRTYANPHYAIETLPVDPTGYNAMYAYCQQRAASGVDFDNLGMVLAALPVCWHTPPDRTFCSRHVAEVLQAGKVPEFLLLTPHRTTPTMIHKAARASNRTFFSSVPFKIGLLVQEACPPPQRRGIVDSGSIHTVSFRR
eukprot:768787-Hanusia_phi.AAC.1